MSFLFPAALALAAAAIIPLLIHLWRRRLGARIDFPAARYLARAEREHSRRLRLRNLLLMLARVAAVVLLAIAAARPMTTVGSVGHAPTALAIVLDNSMSAALAAGGVTTLARLTEAARRAIDAVDASDRVWLITAGARITAGTPEDIRTALDRVEPYIGRPEMGPAMALARDAVLAAPEHAPSVLVLTDGQRSTWQGVLPLSKVSVVTLRQAPPDSVRNRAVVSAVARPRRWLPRGAVDARVATTDSVAYRATIVSGARTERTLARGVAGPDGAILVGAAPPERGWVTGAVELEPDELRLDDRRWFATWIGERPRVTVDASAGPFVSRALSVLADDGRVERAPGGVVIAGAEAASKAPSLLFAPRDPVSLGAANRALAMRGIGWRLGARVDRVESVVGAGLTGVETHHRYALERVGPSSSETLATVSGQPWIVAGRDWVLVASAADSAATTLPLRAAFLPWLLDVISQRLGGAPGEVREAEPLQHLLIPRGAATLDGARGRISVKAPVAAPNRAGAWAWRNDAGEAVGVVLVNPDTAESRLEWLDAAALTRITGGRVEEDAALAVRAALETPGRRPVGGWLLGLAAAALLLELLLARDAGSRDKAKPSLAEAA